MSEKARLRAQLTAVTEQRDQYRKLASTLDAELRRLRAQPPAKPSLIQQARNAVSDWLDDLTRAVGL